MKKLTFSACVVVVVLSLSTGVWALNYTFQPKDKYGNFQKDLWDLDHGKAYSWGINLNLQENERIVGASISFDNIRNWTNEANDLWLRLLDNVDPYAKQINDYESGAVDYFAGQGLELNHWKNLSHIAQDLTYTFDTAELAMLTNYISNGVNGNFGLGFDPDCHFYNDGITFKIDTVVDAPIVTPPPAVPEPTTLLLLGVGLLGMFGFKRSLKK